MALNAGIVGLPNVGKSTLFLALTSNKTNIANYPFSTIDPNIGVVKVFDSRLLKIKNLINPERVLPAVMEFVDIAGLVKGASKNEGLGNKFLANIREVLVILHVVRCFKNKDVIHIEGEEDPERDINTINLELCFADLETVEKSIQKNEKNIKNSDKSISESAKLVVFLLRRLKDHLMQAKPAISFQFTKTEANFIKTLNLLTNKKVIYVCNVDEDSISGNKYTEIVRSIAEKEKNDYIVLSAKIEAELSGIKNDNEKKELLEAIGIKNSGIDSLIRLTYHTLGLRSYFTVGKNEVKAWSFKDGIKASEAAGIIHSDMQKGFIKAEVYSCEELFKFGSVQSLKENGKIRLEGKDYLVKDGDVIFFKFNI